MSTAAQLLARDVPALARALDLTTAEARLEARLLLGRALRKSRAWLIAHDDDPLPAPAVAGYEAWLARRLAGEPMAYVLGEKEFFGRTFAVSPAVLIPRPETELLVELALSHARALAAPEILDLGTGSGCLAITLALECPAAKVTAVEASIAALAVARQNAALHQADVAFVQARWFDGLAGRRFDIIVANPPYVPAGDPHLHQGDVRHEPASALVAGDEGLADIAAIISGARTQLRPGGVLLLEHGYNQAERVRSGLAEMGYVEVASFRDLAGIERVSGAKVSE